MVGGGVFMLPANLAQVSGSMGSTLAWSITGLGVFMIALVFGNLAIRKPELKAECTKLCSSDVSFKKAGKVAGYSMAWGYWALTGRNSICYYFLCWIFINILSSFTK